MKNIKFVVKLNRGGNLVPEFVQRIDLTPIQISTVALRDKEVILVRLIWEQMEARRDELLGSMTAAQKQAGEVRAERMRALRAEILAARKRKSKDADLNKAS
jgi:hypothetical protein